MEHDQNNYTGRRLHRQWYRRMSDIYDIQVISRANKNQFMGEVAGFVRSYQADNLDVEIQFSSCAMPTEVWHTAYIVARKRPA
jgi:hypothetical protein